MGSDETAVILGPAYEGFGRGLAAVVNLPPRAAFLITGSPPPSLRASPKATSLEAYGPLPGEREPGERSVAP